MKLFFFFNNLLSTNNIKDMTKKKYLIKNQKLFQKKKNKSKKNQKKIQKKNKTSKKKQRKTKIIISKIIKKSNNNGKKTRIKKKNNKLFNLKGGLGKCYIETETLPTLIESMAPESYSKGEFSTASDIWSLGLTFWEIFYNDSRLNFYKPFYNCETEDVEKYFLYLTKYGEDTNTAESPDKVQTSDLKNNNQKQYKPTNNSNAADWFKDYVFVEELNKDIKTLFEDCLKINRTDRKAASMLKDNISIIMRKDIKDNIFPQRETDTGINKGYIPFTGYSVKTVDTLDFSFKGKSLTYDCSDTKRDSNMESPTKPELSPNRLKQKNKIDITKDDTDTNYFLSVGKYSVTELSQGNFGKVFKIEKQKKIQDDKPNELAYKILIPEEGKDTNDESKLFWNEYVISKVLSNLNSSSIEKTTDNVVRCYGSDEGKLNFGDYGGNGIKIFMEFAPYGNIPSFFQEHLYDEMSNFYKQYIEAKGDVSSEQTILKIKLQMCWNITNGIEFLHDQYFIHNDIGSRNVMVFKSPSEHQIPIICKIGDFGKTVQLKHSI